MCLHHPGAQCWQIPLQSPKSTPILPFLRYLPAWVLIPSFVGTMGNACDSSALSPNMCACFIPNHDARHVTSCGLRLRAEPRTRPALFPCKDFQAVLSPSPQLFLQGSLWVCSCRCPRSGLCPPASSLSPSTSPQQAPTYPSRLVCTHFIP